MIRFRRAAIIGMILLATIGWLAQAQAQPTLLAGPVPVEASGLSHCCSHPLAAEIVGDRQILVVVDDVPAGDAYNGAAVVEYDRNLVKKGEAVYVDPPTADAGALYRYIFSSQILGQTPDGKVRILLGVGRGGDSYSEAFEVVDYTLGGGSGILEHVVLDDLDGSSGWLLQSMSANGEHHVALSQPEWTDLGIYDARGMSTGVTIPTGIPDYYGVVHAVANDGSMALFGTTSYTPGVTASQDITFWIYDPLGNLVLSSILATNGISGRGDLIYQFSLRFYDNDTKVMAVWGERQAGRLSATQVRRFTFPGGVLIGSLTVPAAPESLLIDFLMRTTADGSLILGVNPGSSFLGSLANGFDYYSPEDVYLGTLAAAGLGGDGIILNYSSVYPNGDLTTAIGVGLYSYTFPDCGNGAFEVSNSEECDDGNDVDLDGCATDCTIQACGNGVVDTGEGCDGGNTVSGDGCSSICLLEEIVNQSVAPGGSTGSDAGEGDGATPSDPLETSVTVPSGGEVIIIETDDDGGPQGFSGLGKKVLISAPAQTVQDPLVISFTADSSMIPAGETGTSVQVFRNGARVLPCTGAPDAIPDPCISGIAANGDDYVLTVLTSAASEWQLGFVCGDGTINATLNEECDDGNVAAGDGCSSSCSIETPQSEIQAACLASLTKSAVTLVSVQAKVNKRCLKGASTQKIEDARVCLTADNKALAKVRKGWNTAFAKSCSDATPDFGYSKDGLGTNLRWRELLAALLGDVNPAVVDSGVDKSGAGCQQSVLKAADTYGLSAFKEFTKCVKQQSVIRSLDTYEDCLFVDAGGKIASTFLKLQAVREKTCANSNLATVFPGDCSAETGSEFDTCIATETRCATCRVLKFAHALSVDCDEEDDGLDNQSCS